jgi:hypothetical protein
MPYKKKKRLFVENLKEIKLKNCDGFSKLRLMILFTLDKVTSFYMNKTPIQ